MSIRLIEDDCRVTTNAILSILTIYIICAICAALISGCESIPKASYITTNDMSILDDGSSLPIPNWTNDPARRGGVE